ncbi:MAG TPA: 4Fe-4S binding protein [Dehalococcoidia bacterium]|jgi:NAD-dependent dihydropyrimidine dehydrogenase PreA subunit
MTYVITEPCIGTKDMSCIDVCPVDCIYGKDEDEQLYIDAEKCIDCAACEAACPVTAIFFEDDVPAQWQSYLDKQRDYCDALDPQEREHGFRPRSQRA